MKTTGFDKSGEWMVALVCTGRGQHAACQLALFSWWPGGERPGLGYLEPHHSERGGTRRAGAVITPRPSIAISREGRVWGYRTRCPRCRRDYQWRRATMAELVQGAFVAGVSEMDMSGL